MSPPAASPQNSRQNFRAIDVIRKKRDGMELSTGEIESLVSAYTRDEIPDYQVSAWLMAVVLRGHDAGRNLRADRRDAALRRGSGSFCLLREESRQALHRRGGRQDVSGAGAGRGRRRSCRSHDQRPRPGTYRRHARQARGDSRLQRESFRRASFAACWKLAAAP